MITLDQEQNFIQESFAEQGRAKIETLKRRIDETVSNVEISERIIDATPSDAQRDKLTEKNVKRLHAVGSMKKEIRDIEQRLRDDEREP